MWTAGQIVSLLKDYMGEVSREKRREYLSRAYMELVTKDIDQLIYYNRTDIESPFPLLDIQEGTKVYTLDDNLINTDGTEHLPTIWNSPVGVRKVARVFTPRRINSTQYGYYREFPEYFPFGDVAYLAYNNEKIRYYEVPVSAIPRQGNNKASVTFFDDPTQYGDKIYVEFWYAPPAVTSDSSPLLIDTDKFLQTLINGAVGYYEDVVNGNSARLSKFENEDMHKFTVEGTESQRIKISQRFPTREIG